MADTKETAGSDPDSISGEFAEHVDPTAGGSAPFHDPAAGLSEEHKAYLLDRHGTLDLYPMPSMSPADPYNWPQWKKITNLCLIAFHACGSAFAASAIIPAFPDIAVDLGVSLQRTTYLTSLQIAILGGAPIFWIPLANTFGRRPIFIISLLVGCAGNIGCARSHSYAAMAACRAIVSFFLSPPAGVGSAIVAETFFAKDRALYMGCWTVSLAIGVPLAPFLMGFVAYHAGYRWIYWVCAIMNGVNLIAYFLFGPESLYMRDGSVHHPKSKFKEQYFNFRRINPKPMRLYDFVHPLMFWFKPYALTTMVTLSMVFLWTSILPTVMVPQLFGAKFAFNAQQLGLQFLGILIGSVIGEILGGGLSDWWMRFGTKRLGTRPAPEYRLWLTYPAYALSILGMVVFLVQIDHARPLHWVVSPVIGTAFAAGGNQIITTVGITYAVDCDYSEAGSVGVFIIGMRQLWAFCGPFWFPKMFDNVGIAESAGIGVGTTVGVSIIPTIAMHIWGKHWRPTEPGGGFFWQMPWRWNKSGRPVQDGPVRDTENAVGDTNGAEVMKS